MLCGEQTQKISEKKSLCMGYLANFVHAGRFRNWWELVCDLQRICLLAHFFLGCISHVSDGVNRGCKMKPDEPTPGTKPVLKEQRQRIQSGQRKEEKEAAENEWWRQWRAECSRDKEDQGGGGAQRGSLFTVPTYMCVYAARVCVNVCVIHRCGHGGRKKSAEDKGRKKTGGRPAQTGSQPNQFGLAESGCTISHQSTFSMLSDRPSIHRGQPLSTLLGNRREKKGKTKRERERGKKHAHTCRGYQTSRLVWYPLCSRTSRI